MSGTPEHPYGAPYEGHAYPYQEPYHPEYQPDAPPFEAQPVDIANNAHIKESDDGNADGPADNLADTTPEPSPVITNTKSNAQASDKENDEDVAEAKRLSEIETEDVRRFDAVAVAQNELIAKSKPTTELEIALSEALNRKEIHVQRLTGEIMKLKQFLSKRKQTYKRKRKDDGAPTRPLSGYNLFIRDRFAKLATENENALKSDDMDATLKRVPPASIVTKTGNQWKELSAEEKARYDERAKSDRKRYEEQMAEYQPPDKHSNRKRNKTGYNMFFSAHVLRLKETESGVPSERGSVARLVGSAWKTLTMEEKAYYEREADKHNGMNPVKEGEEEEDDEDVKHQMQEYQMQAHPEMHLHPAHLPAMAHDPRAHHHAYYPPHMYGPPHPYGHYDYSQHHQRHQRAAQGGYQQQGYPASQRHQYET